MPDIDAATSNSWIQNSAKQAPPERGTAKDQQPRARPLLVFFHSKLDGRSRRVEGYLAQVLQRRLNHGTFTEHRIDVHERPDLAERFRIESVPTLVVVADRRVQARLEHPKGCRDIEAMLAPWLSPGQSRRRVAAT
jgi:thioredoxin-like negative regulator of GroEL